MAMNSMKLTLDSYKLQYQDYIGDGVYVGFDGYHIGLFAEQPEGIQRIFLDGNVSSALLRYKERIALQNGKV